MVLIFYVKTCILVIVLGLALYYDIKEQKIKNHITLPAAAVGLLINFIDQGSAGLIFSLKGWLVPVVFLMILYAINVMGAGDIKLFAAIGAVMGPLFVVNSFVFSICAGGIIAVGMLIKRKVFIERMKNLFNYFKFIFITRKFSAYSAKEDKESKFIFTTAIVPGTLLVLVLTILHLKGVTINGRELVWFQF